jgi:hypothetical protein
MWDVEGSGMVPRPNMVSVSVTTEVVEGKPKRVNEPELVDTYIKIVRLRMA